MDCRWWVGRPYLFLIFTIFIVLQWWLCNQKDGVLVKEGDKRLKAWKDFFKSDCFIKGRYDYNHASIDSGDYIMLLHDADSSFGSEVVYMKYDRTVHYLTKDIDMNDVYNISWRLLTLSDDGVLYSGKSHHCYDYNYCIYDMNTMLCSDGYSIVAIYNKYGDVKWIKSETTTNRSLIRQAIYGIAPYLWVFVFLIISFASPLIMLIDNM